MYNYAAGAIDKIRTTLLAVRPQQIEMAYWRKTPVGIPFSQTVCCAGGWVCLMGGFREEGLVLLAADPRSEWGAVPALRIPNKGTLRGYAALGYVIQEVKDMERAEDYGRSLFALRTRSPFDRHIGPLTDFDPKGMMQKRLDFAVKQMRQGVPEV